MSGTGESGALNDALPACSDDAPAAIGVDAQPAAAPAKAKPRTRNATRVRRASLRIGEASVNGAMSRWRPTIAKGSGLREAAGSGGIV